MRVVYYVYACAGACRFARWNLHIQDYLHVHDSAASFKQRIGANISKASSNSPKNPIVPGIWRQKPGFLVRSEGKGVLPMTARRPGSKAVLGWTFPLALSAQGAKIADIACRNHSKYSDKELTHGKTQ